MTFLEKAIEMGFLCSETMDGKYISQKCPADLGLEDAETTNSFCKLGMGCVRCWGRPYKEPEKEKESRTFSAGGLTINIIDGGERTEFVTGAVRDMHAGKGDMASLPWEALLRLSRLYEAGAQKYERWNYRKGIPVSSFVDSATRHLAKYQCGCDDEDHLAAAAFNVLGAMLMEAIHPEMQDLPLREGRKTFDYFEK